MLPCFTKKHQETAEDVVQENFFNDNEQFDQEFITKTTSCKGKRIFQPT